MVRGQELTEDLQRMLINWKSHRRETAQFEHCRAPSFVHEFLREGRFGSIFSTQHPRIPAHCWVHGSESLPPGTAAGESKQPCNRVALAPSQIQALFAFCTFPTSSPTCQGLVCPNTILQPPNSGSCPPVSPNQTHAAPAAERTEPIRSGRTRYSYFSPYIHSISWRHGADLYQRSSFSAPEFSGWLHMSLPQRLPAHALPARYLFTVKIERDA